MSRPSLTEADIEAVIKMVEGQPSIWDKSCNKDSAEKKKAWREICKHFSWNRWGLEWDVLDEEEQKKIEETYRGKWGNLRDTFIKTIKSGSSQRYKYHDLLKFLMKNDYSTKQTTPPPAGAGPSNKPRIGNQPTPPLTEAGPENTGNQKRQFPAKLSPKQMKRPSLSTKSAAKRTKLLSSVTPKTAQAKTSVSPQINEIPPQETTVTNSVSSTTDSYEGIVDADEAFFISIRPHVKKFSDVEKLEFRMQVIKAIQDIKKESRGSIMSVSTSPNNGGTGLHVTNVKEEYTVADSD